MRTAPEVGREYHRSRNLQRIISIECWVVTPSHLVLESSWGLGSSLDSIESRRESTGSRTDLRPGEGSGPATSRGGAAPARSSHWQHSQHWRVRGAPHLIHSHLHSYLTEYWRKSRDWHLLLRLNTRLTSHVNTDCPAARFSDQTQLQGLMKNGWRWRPYSTALLLTFRLFTKCIRHWNFCELRMYSSYYVR